MKWITIILVMIENRLNNVCYVFVSFQSFTIYLNNTILFFFTFWSIFLRHHHCRQWKLVDFKICANLDNLYFNTEVT